MTPAENARQAIAVEEQIRATWPRGLTSLFDERARQLARRLQHAGNHRKARVFHALEVERLQYEPTMADLVRIGLSPDSAYDRVTRRAVEFQRLCARLWRWKIEAGDRYVD